MLYTVITCVLLRSYVVRIFTDAVPSVNKAIAVHYKICIIIIVMETNIVLCQLCYLGLSHFQY